jgi:hypothetical protein
MFSSVIVLVPLTIVYNILVFLSGCSRAYNIDINFTESIPDYKSNSKEI